MSKTKTDLAKVAQMLDTGWQVHLFRNQLGSYTATGRHPDTNKVKAARDMIVAAADPEFREMVRYTFYMDNEIDTDDFTPEQALTRLAYKVHGEVLR